CSSALTRPSALGWGNGGREGRFLLVQPFRPRRDLELVIHAPPEPRTTDLVRRRLVFGGVPATRRTHAGSCPWRGTGSSRRTASGTASRQLRRGARRLPSDLASTIPGSRGFARASAARCDRAAR